MYDLNTVIKEFNKLIKRSPKDSIQKKYYEIIVKYLLLEKDYRDQVYLARKPLLHYFQYSLPVEGKDYFEFLYNPYNPVRVAVETFDSIEEIKAALG